MREYNDRIVYDWFSYTFPVYCGVPDLNVPPVPIDYSPCSDKRTWYNYDPFPSEIYVTSEKYVSAFTTPYEELQVILMNYDDTNIRHTIMSENPWYVRGELGYW